jgi:MFS family permease
VEIGDRLPALRHRHFRNWVIGAFVSNIGGQLQAWAIFWHLDHLTHQPMSVGIVGLVRIVPLIGLGLFGGVVADQFDRRKVLVLTQTGMALSAAGLATATILGLITPTVIYLFVALDATARAFDGPVRQAIVPNLVPLRDYPNAASINGIQWRLGEVLGPALTGVLIAGLGATHGTFACYSLNAVSYGAVIGVVLLQPSYPPKTSRSTSVREVFLSIGEGIKFLRTTKVLANAMWIDFWGTFFAGAVALLPAFARAVLHLDPRGYGLLAASAGFGAMLASAFLAWMPTIYRQGRWVIIMITLYGFSTVLFGLSRTLWVAMLFLACTGAADMISTVLRQTIRQLAIPDALRGRLSGIGMIFQVSGPQAGDFEAATLAEYSSVRASLMIGGFGAMLIAAWYRWRAPTLDGYVSKTMVEGG